MKSIKLSIVALFLASASFAQVKDAKIETAKATQAPVDATVTPAAAPKQSAIKWDKEIHDFGDIPKGVPATYEFTFTNNTKVNKFFGSKDAFKKCIDISDDVEKLKQFYHKLKAQKENSIFFL